MPSYKKRWMHGRKRDAIFISFGYNRIELGWWLCQIITNDDRHSRVKGVTLVQVRGNDVFLISNEIIRSALGFSPTRELIWSIMRHVCYLCTYLFAWLLDKLVYISRIFKLIVWQWAIARINITSWLQIVHLWRLRIKMSEVKRIYLYLEK